ncbi:MAG: valine--tRNA ligase [bacterium]|nr:valine--tRNA ligase [bacterium]
MSGKGKDLPELGSVYDPSRVEARIYDLWLRENSFRAEVAGDKPPFTIVIPPPNVTGSLHMGHALNNTIQDVLIRWRRMAGDEALWLPGSDHAGIATQHVVEERLAEEGLTRHDLGRAAFLDRVWAWKEEYEEVILGQLRRLGASCDWSRLRFTMDEGCSRAVREVFVSLWEKGLIYRGDYIINWCPDCHTALSDIEVEHEDTSSHLWTVRYDLEGGGHVSVATTRPETILGDTGVAVNPGDERYRDLVGRMAFHPLLDRGLPIVPDPVVDPAFGTGAVKVTPAHDPTDFEIAGRHGLAAPVVIDEAGKMTAEAGRYQGLDRLVARRAVLEDLEEQGRLEGTEDYRHAVGHCYRCQTTVEPLLSRQWFVRMKPLAAPAMAAVRAGDLQFVPERFAKVYLNWLEGIRDWCISRQLWWGHRIPAWHCSECGEITVRREDPSACAACGGRSLEQDPDVLDTWFSSALWPFSTLGWPESTPDLDRFYPTTVLVTAYDIIFFWVARMVFMGLEFTGRLPFRQVLIHGLVRNADGRKMSKSLGTGVDPLEAVDRYGADALRLSLLIGTTPGNDMRFQWERVEAARNFANKLWNAARFTLPNLRDFAPAGPAAPVELADRWILARLRRVVEGTDRHLSRFDLGEAARQLHAFTWSELCDWYIELAKPRLYGEAGESRRQAQFTLWRTLETTLRLLHPFIPAVTEEIWGHLPHLRGTACRSPWPRPEEYPADPVAEELMGPIMEVTRAIRTIRSEFNVPPSVRASVLLRPRPGPAERAVRAGESYIAHLASADLRIVAELPHRPEGTAVAVVAGVDLQVPLKDLIDLEREADRLRRGLAAARQEEERSRRKLEDRAFLDRAPEDIVARERDRRREAREKVEKLESYLEALR